MQIGESLSRDIRAQRTSLDELGDRLGDSASAALENVIEASTAATDDLIAWLEAEADSKTGPSGIGKENYTWYQRNVHLLPMTWEVEERGDNFQLKHFFDKLNVIESIPIALVRWEMTGRDDQIDH